LFSQNAILLAQIVNDEQLMLAHPAGDGDPARSRNSKLLSSRQFCGTFCEW
jgi:hypothetical protein